MPFNGPIDGDYTNVDFKKAPWVNEMMILTHDECVHCVNGFKQVIEAYDPDDHYGDPISEMQVHSDYNKLDWQYAISLDTFNAVRHYDPEVNKDGLDENGIIQPEEPEEPTKEEETIFPEEPSEDPIEEDTTEVVEEETEAPTKETTTEDPAE